jgi:hypothetical protein
MKSQRKLSAGNRLGRHPVGRVNVAQVLFILLLAPTSRARHAEVVDATKLDLFEGDGATAGGQPFEAGAVGFGNGAQKGGATTVARRHTAMPGRVQPKRPVQWDRGGRTLQLLFESPPFRLQIDALTTSLAFEEIQSSKRGQSTRHLFGLLAEVAGETRDRCAIAVRKRLTQASIGISQTHRSLEVGIVQDGSSLLIQTHLQ